jgi:hypothetical protein
MEIPIIIVVLVLISFALLLSFAVRKKNDVTHDKTRLPSTNSNFITKNKVQFEDLTEVIQALEHISNSEIQKINMAISGKGKPIIDTIKYVKESNTYLVKFTSEGQNLLGMNKAEFVKKGDNLVPQLRVKGKFSEHSTMLTKNKQVFSKLTNVANMVVSVAHIISGAEQMKELNKISSGVTFLIQDRSNELKAHLESIFDYIEELELTADEEFKDQELRRLSKELYKLRSHWNRNLQSKLNDIENEHHNGFFRTWFGWGKNKRDESMTSKIANGAEEIIMMRMSLMLHMIVFNERGELDVFQKKILPKELNKIKKTRQLLEEKTEYITATFEGSDESLGQIQSYYDRTILEFDYISTDRIVAKKNLTGLEEVEIEN